MSAIARFALESFPIPGALAIRAFLPVELRQRKAAPSDPAVFNPRLLFRVDPGADVCMMSMAQARARNLDVPGVARLVRVIVGTGEVNARVRIGLLLARIPGLNEEPFGWPCYFWEDRPASVPPLLGMAGVVTGLRRLKLTIDGTPSPDEPDGALIVESVRD